MIGFGRGGGWRGSLLITRFFLWWPAFLAVLYRDQRGLGDGVKPCRGRTEGRTGSGEGGAVVMQGRPTADRVAQIALPFICERTDDLQEGGGGSTSSNESSLPFRAKRRWVS